MLGAIVGDIVGSVYEWHNIKTKEFPLFRDDCFFTDDTVMTCAVAEAVMNGGERDDFITLKTSMATIFPRRWMKSVLRTASMRLARIPYRRRSSLFWKVRTLRMPSETLSPLAATATPLRQSRAASQRRHTAFLTGLRTRRIPIWMSC